MADMPEAKAWPEVPPSSEATLASRAKRVGFCTRAYSNSAGSPRECWTYVEVW
jgi:hypothetical protein